MPGRRGPPTPATSGAWASSAAASVDRKSTRLNSSHVRISYAVFCLKKKKKSQHSGKLRVGEQDLVAMKSALIARPRRTMMDDRAVGLSREFVIKNLLVYKAVLAYGV